MTRSPMTHGSRAEQVHPAKWNDPSPKKYYDLVVIGAGAGRPCCRGVLCFPKADVPTLTV